MKRTKSKACKESSLRTSREWVSVSQNLARTCEPNDTPATQPRSPVVQGGRIYFVRAGEAVKIGFTNKLAERFRALQVASPTELELLADIPGTVADEQSIHFMFAPLHIRGEWFSAHRTLLQFINRVAGRQRPISYRRLRALRPEALTYG